MKRYRERPSIWHVIVTCLGLLYLLGFISGWLSLLENPPLRSAANFWSAWIAFGLVFAWIASFLIRELIRQFRLYRQWKSS
jgi:phosphotransferase system  glucose/maltose/N-acetylglucosamine-specific IIC component